MTDLNPRARALIRAGRGAWRPSADDRERIESALRERLGPDALTPESSVSAPVTKSLSWQSIAAGAALSACVLGAVAYLALRPAVNAPAPAARSATVASQPVVSHVPESPVSEPARSEPPALKASQRLERALPNDGLAREVALLSRATTALRAGNPALALKALDEHQHRFPNGALSEERRAARARALCSLGRMEEGRRQLSQLTPGTPASALAEQLCARPPSAAGH